MGIAWCLAVSGSWWRPWTWQNRRFEVQVHGIGLGGDIWIVDRFSITLSNRPDPSREGQVHPIKPFAEPWDWRLLLKEVLQKTYKLGDGSGREMPINRQRFCDSGGGAGTTANRLCVLALASGWSSKGGQGPRRI